MESGCEPSSIERYSWLVVTDISQKRLQGFSSYSAWKFTTMRARNVHGRFSGKNPVFPKWALMWYFRGLMAQNGPSNRVIPILLENGSKDFSDFLHEVRG